jgi:hypothetical protein
VFCDVFLEAWKKGRDKKHGKECEKEVSWKEIYFLQHPLSKR